MALSRSDLSSEWDAAADQLRRTLLTGTAVLVPFVVTLYVLVFVATFLLGLFEPVAVALIEAGVAPLASTFAVQLLAVVAVLVLVFVLGGTARLQYGRRAIDYVDDEIQRVPGIGSFYGSFRKVSRMLLEDSDSHFSSVKLVEFPEEGIYTLGFETTPSPTPLREAAGRDDLSTLFLPLAPNPVMGGFLAHVPSDRVQDVDMTVEEGIETVMTTGVATADVDETLE